MIKLPDTTDLGSRLRRLSQLMLADVDRAYRANGLDFRTRLFPVIFALHRDEPRSIGDLTATSGFTQPATSQTVRQLERAGYVAVCPGQDARSRTVTLTGKGRELVENLLPFWTKAGTAVEELLNEAAPDFMKSLDALEAALEARSLFARIAGQGALPEAVEILPFTMAEKAAFRDLNHEWLEAYFRVEDYDVEQLEHPERILERGGEIWFARLAGRIVGTGALFCHGNGEYEIAKMAVTQTVRGRGIGKRLVETLIQRFRERGGRRLRLETNATLTSAIALYRQVGFVEHPPEKPSRYARANVFMEWRETRRTGSR